MKAPGPLWQALAWAMLAAGAGLMVRHATAPAPVVEARPAVGVGRVGWKGDLKERR